MFGMFDKFYRYFGCSEYQTKQTRIACFAFAAFMASAVEAISCPWSGRRSFCSHRNTISAIKMPFMLQRTC
uniref:Uncharacterized protein n=1 Tax=Wuchereria bancrofti TaxID=6293 RepID=A0A1I8EYD4_WUCBA